MSEYSEYKYNMVGYRINGPQKFQPGAAYDYTMYGDGIWISGHNPHLYASALVAPGKVRGLEPHLDCYKGAELRHGKIPQRFFDLAISVMVARPEKEVYVAIAWGGSSYQLVIPEQEGSGARVEYSTPDNIVCELHSHGKMGAFFSTVDDADEQGLRIYGVVGELYEETPVLALRLGVYGYFMPLRWTDVFDGGRNGAVDVTELEAKDKADEL